MKRFCIFCLVVSLLIIIPVKADLMVQDYLSNGQKVVLDTVTGHHWYWNMPDFTNMTYSQQTTAIAGLGTYGNIAGGWYMATEAEVAALFGNSPNSLVTSFAPTGTGVVPGSGDYYEHWEGRWDGAYTDPISGQPSHYKAYFHHESPGGGFWSGPKVPGYPDTDRLGHLGAWIVTDQPVVPVPPAVLLGMLGLGVAGMKLRKQA